MITVRRALWVIRLMLWIALSAVLRLCGLPFLSWQFWAIAVCVMLLIAAYRSDWKENEG